MTESPIESRIVPLFQADEIEREVLDLGRRLSRDLADDDPLFLSLLSGSVIFLADLVRAYEPEVRYEFVQVGYHHPEVAAAELLEIQYPIAFDLADQHLLVVKDVVSTGVTENYLAEQFLQKGAKSVRFAALIDLPDERKTELEVLYHAFSVDRTGPLVGYGLKYDGRYGNLPYIGRLEDAP
ncbi:MAG: phosphoribosyltransferase family protein [Acidobacteriota bacterium]|jgi:hypoxanthine phosphoribosyltransferase